MVNTNELKPQSVWRYGRGVAYSDDVITGYLFRRKKGAVSDRFQGFTHSIF